MLTSALPAVDEPALAARKKFSSISLLPDGSELHDVMFPRYDATRRLIGVLKAKSMTLVNNDTISGRSVAIEFFNPDSSPRGHVDMRQAVFYQTKGLLEAREPVIMQSDRIHAKGTGLSYAFEQGKGFLIGPVITWIQPRPETSMNSSRTSTRNGALLGLSLLTLPIAAAPPPKVSPAELAKIQTDTAPAQSTAGQAAAAAQEDLTRDTSDAAAASAAVKAYVARAGLPAVEAEPSAAEAKPLEMKPGANDTVVTCDGGMYFDAEGGLFVYLKNVRVNDPRFTLSGANELKIFLGKKPAKDPAKPADEKTKPADEKTKLAKAPEKTVSKDPLGGGFSGKFGDVERIVATGAVRLVQKPSDASKEPIEASGAIFTYHTRTGQMILSGGYPWVKQGATFMRAEQPNLNLRILKSGSFVTEGKWVMGGPINRK